MSISFNLPIVGEIKVRIEPDEVERQPPVESTSDDLESHQDPVASGTDKAVLVVNVAPSTRSQLQQPEVVKVSLKTEGAGAQEAAEVVEGSAPQRAAAAIHREIPALQEVIRAKIEEQIPTFPEITSHMNALVALLSAAIEEKKVSEIQEQLTTLLEVLISAISPAMQTAFIARLSTLHKELVSMLEGEDWQRNSVLASEKFLAALEHLSNQALEEIASILGKEEPSAPKASRLSGAPRSVEAARDEYVISIPGGWNRKHRHAKATLR